MSEIDTTEMSRLRWRCRRGMLELDLILNTVLADKYPSLSSSEKQDFHNLLEEQDSVLLTYLQGSVSPTDNKLKELIRKIL